MFTAAWVMPKFKLPWNSGEFLPLLGKVGNYPGNMHYWLVEMVEYNAHDSQQKNEWMIPGLFWSHLCDCFRFHVLSFNQLLPLLQILPYPHVNYPCVSPQDCYIGRLLCGQHELYVHLEMVASISYIARLVVLAEWARVSTCCICNWCLVNCLLSK